ncbi:deoxyguanosinetriphosphate triphosphohydrolase [Novosphingobium mangrovi (ex Huang et al. 2023)]|uniref:Deoxyguanosinetriphosphate triphosphohydrolase-like protein n=1 Tax=Novosphingobium mangrovi (ex Huang et al. 2023) TaxID=2976432 RepID=A0ABT2I3N2_9SPHN|nr:deoxyguanosinetriphosphate triphosphohydrolase [Novosphingobium mangrovi (ex Huang et al. 2023)]MCT2399420.1 deoxyguanosinetriphosphate triphosphohydrolase [Novosphingobium mangrovi (ex Huang et al. 2023)]
MTLAPYASDPTRSRGREYALENAVARGPRSAYQRDRDRIIHSVSFRRLRYKTQVFVAPDGDHYRVRLTHSLEVAQIARVVARILGLDEDLTEALALAHDIGHPPFGHAGEEALDGALHNAGGFDHNAHCLRTLMRLDSPYCEHDGLNLTWETLEGLAKHNGPVAEPNWALAELDAAYGLELDTHASLEAQVAALSDDIAYDNHDIDDGLRAGFLDLDELLAHPFVMERWGEVERRYPDAPRDRQLAELIRSQIGVMVNDLVAQTKANLVGVGSVEEVRAAGLPLVAFSPEMAEAERTFKRFMYEKLYYHPEQIETARRARAVLAELYSAYSQEPVLMEESWIDTLPRFEPERSRHIADYIAGMTDRFAITCHAEIFGHTPSRLTNV